MSITLTESAAKEAQKYIDNAGPESFLRIRLVAGGCSGHNSSLQIDKNYDEKADSKFDFHGVPVVVDKKSELYLEDAKLDFIQGLERSGFHLDIPAAKKTCGCGSSYQF
jgi:iron-sulfur cluster assembly protein